MHYLGIAIAPNEEAIAQVVAPFDMNLAVEPHLVEDREEWLDDYRSDAQADLRAIENDNREPYLGLDKQELEHRLTLSDDELAALVIPERTKQGYKYDENSNRLDRYNEDGYWDWWVVGGRWEADFQKIQGIPAAEYATLLESDSTMPLPNSVAYVGWDEEPVWEDRSGWLHADEKTHDEWLHRVIEILKDAGDGEFVYFIDFHE
ncbi:hypothetical protein [Bifidobacterium callitrichidarum]|uniref:Uncharacterized protein n=1 Tax=Bifidobacterium callitrichidarum TaxID=2052941 RepID=A0A2U2MYJ1_9BIFI|nr:hypothetical protein [Bifidobacterium callitrichidarum]PWG62071.1 hypothetical protein DF196_12655 [Bifidobacterium callitrichidarum]